MGHPVGLWGWAGTCRLSLSMRMGVGVGGGGMVVLRGVLGLRRGGVGRVQAGPAAHRALGSPRPQQLAADVVRGQGVAGVGPQVPQGVLGGPQCAGQGGQALLGLLQLLQGVAACAGQVLHAGAADQARSLVGRAGLLRHQQIHHLQHGSVLEPMEGAVKASGCGRISCMLSDSVQMEPAVWGDCYRIAQSLLLLNSNCCQPSTGMGAGCQWQGMQAAPYPSKRGVATFERRVRQATCTQRLLQTHR